MVSTRTTRIRATPHQPPSRRANRDGPERRNSRHSGVEQLDSEAESDELGSARSPRPRRSGSPPGGSPNLSSDDGDLSSSSDDAQPRRYTQVEVDALVRNASDNAARAISRANRQQASPRREERSYAKPTHPTKYDGDSKKLEPFVQHLEQNFAVYPRHYTTEAEKVAYAISHLGEQAAVTTTTAAPSHGKRTTLRLTCRKEEMR